MSHSTHGGFLLQRYCPWAKLCLRQGFGGQVGFRSFIPHGILQRSNSNFLAHGSHIISVDVTSGMPCPRLSKSIVSMAIFILKSRKKIALYPTHKWANFTARLISTGANCCGIVDNFFLKKEYIVMNKRLNTMIVLLSIISSFASLYPYCIVYIHIGKNLPAFFYDSARQTRLFNKTCTIYLLANQQAITDEDLNKFEDYSIKFIALESLVKTKEHEEFLQKSTLDKNFWEAFWLYTSERFLYLHDFCQQYHESDIIHLENDNMIYVDFNELMPVFKRHYKGIGAVFDNDYKCIPGIVFFRYAAHGKCDMEVFSILMQEKREAGLIDNLPIIMPEYVHIHGLGSTNGTYSPHKERFFNHIDEFQSIFDGAALGQYFGGKDPRLGDSGPGFVNESCLYNSSLLSYRWVPDNEGRNIPYASYRDHEYRINNLHVHCKNLKQFSSK